MTQRKVEGGAARPVYVVNSVGNSVPVTGVIASANPEFLAAYSGEISERPAYVVYIIGRRSLGWVDTATLGDCAQYLDTTQRGINTPSPATTLYLVSTSASDTAAGSGARTVRIVYLDADGHQQTTTRTLSGLTPVNIGSGYAYIQWMEVALVGSGEVSAGNVTVSSTNGAATAATTFGYIAAGGNRSLSGRYKVPTGFTAYLLHWHTSSISAAMDSRLRATVFADDRSLSTVHHFQDAMYLAAGGAETRELSYFACPAGSEIKVSAVPGQAAAGNRLDSGFEMLVISNTWANTGRWI